MVVPVPKKQAKGVCNVDNFHGVSLSSTVCKVMCMILNNRLSGVAEEEGLIANEQGGFRKQRGCRDQVLSLVLLGQMEMLKKSQGMMIAFIDFSKAYDKVDRDKLWKCLEKLGVNSKFLWFLQSLCEVGCLMSMLVFVKAVFYLHCCFLYTSIVWWIN